LYLPRQKRSVILHLVVVVGSEVGRLAELARSPNSYLTVLHMGRVFRNL